MIISLTQTSRNQKGKVAQCVARQMRENAEALAECRFRPGVHFGCSFISVDVPRRPTKLQERGIAYEMLGNAKDFIFSYQ